MKIMAKIKNFTKQAMSFMAGDTDGVIAAQNERKCTAAFESQIAVLKGKRVDLEEVLSDRKESLQKAKFPATKITNGQSVVEAVVYAKQAVERAQDALDECNESISYYEAILAEYAEEVDDDTQEQA